MSSQRVIDEAKSEEFCMKMLEILNHGALTSMISIGHRTGLFDSMGGLEGPLGYEAIAEQAGLNERYVKEWLGAMVTGGFVEYDPEKKTYYLPQEHAAWLTRKAAPNNLAVASQWVGVLGPIEDRIIECFRHGGGVHYEEFSRFNEVMAEESMQTVIIPLLDHILPLVPGIKDRLEQGIEVLDVGCGSGYAIAEMARTYPNSRFTGYDLLPSAIERGRARAREYGLTNISYEAKDVTKFDDVNRFDLITTFDAVHDQADPASVLSHIHRALKDDGYYLMQDIKGSSHVERNSENPLATFLYTVSCMHCMTVSLAQGGEGLGAMWGEEKTREYLARAGFGSVVTHRLAHDIQNNWYVVEK